MEMDPREPILVRSDGGKCYITLNRPRSMNALSKELRRRLAEAIHEFEADDELRVGIITGEGGRAFSTGGDLKEWAEIGEGGDLAWDPVRRGELLGFEEVELCAKPLIAAIDGHCVAGGFELALCCDVRLATTQSRFGMPEARHNMLGGPGLHLLSRCIPMGEAMRIHLSGSPIGAERAHDIGLVQELAGERTELMGKADRLADQIIACAPAAVMAIKQIVRRGIGRPIEESWEFAAEFQEQMPRMRDGFEGPRAFAAKRPPHWTGQ